MDKYISRGVRARRILGVLPAAVLCLGVFASVGALSGAPTAGAATTPGGELTVSPKAWDFGPTEIGSVGEHTFQITNVSTSVLSFVIFTTITTTSTTPFTVVQTDCIGAFRSLQGGQTPPSHCTVTVAFRPTAVGAVLGTLTIVGKTLLGVPNVAIVPLRGFGTTGLTVSPSSLSFGSIGVSDSSTAKIVTVTNTGTPLSITAVALPPASGFAITSDDCTTTTIGSTITTTCTVAVAFEPIAQGVDDSSLLLTIGGQPVSVPLSGTGVANTTATVTPGSITFGKVPITTVSGAKAVTVTNEGSNRLDITTATVAGEDVTSFTIVSDGCVLKSVAPGGSCTLYVVFAPTSPTATLSADIEIHANLNGTILGSPGLTVALKGSGTTAGTGLSTRPRYVKFGTVADTVAAPTRYVTVKNSGTQTVHLGALGLKGSTDYGLTADACSTATLVPAASCKVGLTFTPSVLGVDDATLQIPVTGGNTLDVPIYGTGSNSLSAAVSPPMLTFGPTAVTSMSAEQTVTVTNDGEAVLSITTVTIATSPDASDFGVTNNECNGVTLAPEQSCSVSVYFEPGSVSSTLSAAVAVVDNAGVQTATLFGTSTASPTDITITPSVNFSNVGLGVTSGAMEVTVSDVGTASVHLLTASKTGSDATEFSIVGNSCTGATLDAPGLHVGNTSCTVAVTFTPSTFGTQSAVLSIHEDTGPVLSSLLVGTGVADTSVTVSSWALTFGSVPTGSSSKAMEVVVTDSGANPLFFSTDTVKGHDSTTFTVTLDTCAHTEVAPGLACDVYVVFTPASATTDLSAELHLTANVSGVGTEPGISVALAGNGVTPGTDLSVTPDPIDFGKVGATQIRTIFAAVTNDGTSSVTLGTPSLGFVYQGFWIGTDACVDATLSPGASCTIEVGFTPDASFGLGYFATHLEVPVDTGPQLIVSVSGTAVPATTVSLSTLTFPNTGVGHVSAQQTLTVDNTGTAPLYVTTVAITGGNNPTAFAITTDTCLRALTVAPGASCTIGLVFEPTVVGNLTASLILTDNAAGNPQAIVLNGKATTPVGATSFSMTPPKNGTLSFPDTVVFQTSASEAIRLSVSGPVTLTVTTVAIKGPDASQFTVVTDACLAHVVHSTCEIYLTFTPTSNGLKTARLWVTDNAVGSPQEVNLVGVGVTAVPHTATGYDMVGSDGGVFVFNAPGETGGFYGSLPGIHVVPNKPVVGMVPTVNDHGYFLVAADGGVFAFGNAPFLGSLPGIHVVPNKAIVGIIAADTDKGYYLVGADGGVFAFGAVPYLGSLPGLGITVSNVVGIAALPSGTGYWVVQSTGRVYGFGTALQAGTLLGTSSPVTAIAGTATGHGYWIVTADGTVEAFGNAKSYGTLPALNVTPAHPVIGIVHTAGATGYWLLGSDGGIFAFDAPFFGSLPGLNIHVTNIVAAVPN